MSQCRWCAWDSNPGWQNGRRRQIHWAMAAPFVIVFAYCRKNIHCTDKLFRDRGTGYWQPVLLRIRWSVDFFVPTWSIGPENIDHRRKYHCAADHLFILFRFRYFAYVELASALLVWSNPNQSNRKSAVQWYFPLKSVFSEWTFRCPIGWGANEPTLLAAPWTTYYQKRVRG